MDAELLHDSWQTARIPHRCNLCCMTIEPGQRYYRQHCADGEHRWSHKEHGECHEAAAWAVDEFDLFYDEVPTDDQQMFLDEFLGPYRERGDDDG